MFTTVSNKYDKGTPYVHTELVLHERAIPNVCTDPTKANHESPQLGSGPSIDLQQPIDVSSSLDVASHQTYTGFRSGLSI